MVAVFPIPLVAPENKLEGVKLQVIFVANVSTSKIDVSVEQIASAHVISGAKKNSLTLTQLKYEV